MVPQNILVHSGNSDAAARIIEVLQAGLPSSAVRSVNNATELIGQMELRPQTTIVATPAKPATLCAELRHELNNHLALIRMLADLLAEDPHSTPLCTTKAREIGKACEAAAAVLRRAKQLEG